MWPKYNSNLKKCFTKLTSISKLRIILLTNNYVSFLNKKMQMHCRPARKKAQFKPGLHMDTGYPVQAHILYIKLTFLNKILFYFKYLSIKY